MARSSSNAKKPANRKKSSGGTLLGMFIGLVLGVAAAAAVVWYMNKAPLPFTTKGQQPPRPEQVAAAGKPVEPVALPGKPGDPVPEKRFQFYDILPGKAAPVPDKPGAKPADDGKKDTVAKDEKKEEKKDDKKEEPKESKTPIFIQVGSFSSAQDADNQKAKLAFMGMEAVIQQVMIQDKTLYRVRVGPYTKIDELNKVRAELAKAGIEAQVAKNKE